MIFIERLEKEKEKLDRMIEDHGWQLSSDIILKQSKKVDKLVLAYQKIKQHCIKVYVNSNNRVVRYNVR